MTGLRLPGRNAGKTGGAARRGVGRHSHLDPRPHAGDDTAETVAIAAAEAATATAAAEATIARFVAEQIAEAGESEMPAEWLALRSKPVPPALGARTPGSGRAAFVPRLPRWVGSTHNNPGLYPFVLSAGAPAFGVPFGEHMVTEEPIGVDAGEYLRQGLVTNTGIYITSEPGVGKSTVCRRMEWGLSSFGVGILVPADLKNEHGDLVKSLGGDVFALGRGMHRINLLDPGPLAKMLHRVPAQLRPQLESEIRARAMQLAEGGLRIAGDGAPLSNNDRVALQHAYDLFVRRNGTDTPPDLVSISAVLRECPAELQTVFMVDDRAALADILRPVVIRLELMLNGPLAGLFDGQSTFSIDPATPGVCLDLSRLQNNASDDSAVAIAMLASFGWCASLIDAGQQLAALVDPATGRPAGGRRNWMQLFDEHWRVLRAGTGMVELSDRVTRMGRHTGVQSVMVTHSLDDFNALPTEEDRQKARGMVDRCAIKIIGAHGNRELANLSQTVPITSAERKLISSWSAPPTWTPGAVHPGRGKWMIKTGARLGIPMKFDLMAEEKPFSDTDQAFAPDTLLTDTDAAGTVPAGAVA